MIRFRLLLLFLCSLFTTYSFSQTDLDSVDISILTCSSGPAIYSTFGHSAIRYTDHRRQKDLVFDYGVFNFETPNFLWLFLRGDLNYKLAFRSYEDFMVAYQEEGRGVYEERLNLPAEDKIKVYDFLVENCRPENRFYRYDFLFDNCSTRIRDLLENLESVEASSNINEFSSRSFRQNQDPYLQRKEWIRLGTDLLQGPRADRLMTGHEEMYLPNKLSENLKAYRVGSQPLLQSKKILLAENFTTPGWVKILQPMNVLIFLFLAVIGLLLFFPGAVKWMLPIAAVLFSLVGLFVLFMWFGTSHYPTKWNWNLLWTNPVYLVLLFPIGKKTATLKWMGIGLIGIILVWPFLPQQMNPCFVPVVGIMLVLLAVQWYVSQKEKA